MSDFVHITGSIPYSLVGAFNPYGNNRNNAYVNYIQRKKYKDVPYFLLLPQPLDSWYDKNYFGRVDPIQNGIVVKKDMQILRQIKTERGNVFVLNFVADAFEGLQQHLGRARAAGALSEGSFYSSITATKGMYNYSRDFQEFREQLRKRYESRLVRNKIKFKKVIDFASYVEYLLDYYKTQVAPSPVTLSGYVVSPLSNPMMSGMTIELTTQSYARDHPKVSQYIMDPNFKYFVRAARKYGFYVDRNAPWRLFADPFSEPMKYYVEKADEASPGLINPGAFFNSYYEKTYSLDLTQLKEDLLYMYNKFVERYPVVKEDWHDLHDLPPDARCRDLEPRETYRQPTTIEAVQDMGDLYWLDAYFKFRVAEGNLNFNDYDKRFKRTVEIYRIYGVQKAMRFINNEVKPYLYNSDALRKGLTHVSTRGNLVYASPYEAPPDWYEEIQEAFESGEMAYATAIHTYS